MGRISIYLPDDLESRLARYKDALNLSSIAQDAFERAINVEELKGAGKMHEAKLERLRADRDADAEARQAEGFAAGKEWALDAKFREVQYVAELADDMYSSEPEVLKHQLVKQIAGDGYSVRDAQALFVNHFGRAKPSINEIYGFIEGAREVFDEVE